LSSFVSSLFISVMAVPIAGVLLAWWTAQRADREMREDLLQHAHIVARTLNIDHVKALSGTETDLTLPVYQLAALCCPAGQ
jgi:hypothetical protein